MGGITADSSFSPFPNAQAGPSNRKKGTSAPIFSPSPISSVEPSRYPKWSFRVISTVAALELPPPRPAPIRDLLMNDDPDSGMIRYAREQGRCRPERNIGFVGWKTAAGALDTNPLSSRFEIHPIGKVNLLHQGRQFVIAVLSLPENLQEEIYLCGRGSYESFSFLFFNIPHSQFE